MTENNGFALGWDSPIEQESSFVLLPEGEYNFRVTKMERSQYQPSPTSSIREVSPKADLSITVYDDSGQLSSENVTENLILHSKMEWKLSQFFIAIGQKIPGQAHTPNWNQVVGSTGRCKVEVNRYTNKQGAERENNRIAEFLPPQTQAAPSYQMPPAQPQQTQAYQQATQPNPQALQGAVTDVAQTQGIPQQNNTGFSF